MDTDKDFDRQTIQMNPDYEGEVTATLLSSKFNKGNRKSVLYLHGYVDYFFHPHLGKKYTSNHFDFYALDLRKYGRSLLKHQRPNFCINIEEYFEEISFAIRQIYNSAKAPIYLLGHSTGGLIASNYMNNGQEKSRIKGLLLNSPFLDFNQSRLKNKLTYGLAKIMSNISAYSKVEGALSPIYAQSIHKDFYGEWDFNLAWKPINGFPTYFKWIIAISKAQKQLSHSSIQVPVLIMHSSQSLKTSTFTKEAMSSDIVLNIEDMKRIGSQLGNKVSFLEIEGALHDVFLSPKAVREIAMDKMLSWLTTI